MLFNTAEAAKVKNMANTNTEKPAKDSVVLWQTSSEDGIAEPALLIEFFSDCVSIKQDGETLRITYESVADLCKLLKSHPKP